MPYSPVWLRVFERMAWLPFNTRFDSEAEAFFTLRVPTGKMIAVQRARQS